MDKSEMIRLTPEEIKRLMLEAVKRCDIARANGSRLSLEEVVGYVYSLAVGVLRATDPDRIQNLN